MNTMFLCNMTKLLLISLMFVFLMSSCSRSKEIEYAMNLMCSRKISIPCKDMIHIPYKNDNCSHEQNINKKMIVYIDSTECASCSMKQMFEWNDLLWMEEKRLVQFIFIFQTAYTEDMIEVFNTSRLEHCIYIDTCRVFDKANSHIPDNKMYHTFLIDENDCVLLVGNPIRNSTIMKLFKRIVVDSSVF